MVFRKSSVLIVLSFLISAGCSKDTNNPITSYGTSGSSSNSLPAVNYWTTTPPPIICGQAGYGFLLSQYIGPNCASCHTATGFAPKHFADSNLALATSEALSIGPALFLSKCAKNDFCGPGCNLDLHGQVYGGIAQWFNFPASCP